jgi:hypothetical protein
MREVKEVSRLSEKFEIIFKISKCESQEAMVQKLEQKQKKISNMYRCLRQQ